MPSWNLVDESEHGFGWVQDEWMRRTSHALAVAGRVWLIDPVDDPVLQERVRALGEPAGVLQLLDRVAVETGVEGQIGLSDRRFDGRCLPSSEEPRDRVV